MPVKVSILLASLPMPAELGIRLVSNVIKFQPPPLHTSQKITLCISSVYKDFSFTGRGQKRLTTTSKLIPYFDPSQKIKKKTKKTQIIPNPVLTFDSGKI